MDFEEIGTIKYGNLRFVFSSTKGVSNFFKEKEIPVENLILSSQVFYQTVLKKLEMKHEEEQEIDIVFNGVSHLEEGIHDLINPHYEVLKDFPLTIGKEIFYLDFGIAKKEERLFWVDH